MSQCPRQSLEGRRGLHRPARTAWLGAVLIWTGLTVVSLPGIAQTAGGSPGETVEGVVSWYGKKFAGRKTASGELFDPKAMTMAHPRWSFGTRVRVTNPANSKSVVLRVNDRGPAVKDRVADVSEGAARELDMIKAGLVTLRLEVVEAAPPKKPR